MINILIIGGTGNTGKQIVDLFFRFTDYNLIVIARNKKKLNILQDKYGNRIKTIQLDAKNKIAVDKSLKTVNIIVLAAPTYDCFLNSIMLATELNCKFIDIHCSFENKFDFLKTISTNNLTITDAGLWPGSILSLSRYISNKNTKSVEVAALFNKPGWQGLVNKETLEEHCSLDAEYSKNKCVLRNNIWIDPSETKSKKFNFLPYGTYDFDSTYLKEIYEIKKYIPTIENFGLYARTDIENLDTSMTFLKFFADNTVKLDLYHDCGWFITAAAAVATVFQMIDSKNTGVFLSGNFLNPNQYVDNLRQFGVKINTYQ